MLLWRGTSLELAISSYNGSRLWKLPSSTAPGRGARHHELIPEEGVGLASAAERQAISRLELQRRSSRRRSARNRESTARRQLGQIWRSAALGSIPPEVPGSAGESKNWWFSERSERSCGRRRRSTASWKVQRVESEARRRQRRRHERCSSNLDQANDPGRRSWHQLRPGCLKRKQPLVETGRSGVATASPENRRRGSLSRLWGCTCCVLSRRGRRRWKIYLVREVLRTSFTTVEASGNSVRQRDLLPLPVPCSWAPFAEFLWQAVDEQRHRSSHRERRRRRELHGVGCRSLLAICVLNFLYAGVGHLQELRVCREKPRPAQLAAIRRIVRDARWLVGRAPEDGAAQTTAQIFTQVLKHKRVGYRGEEVSRPEPLTLLEIIPGLPPAGAVVVVEPLTLATGEVSAGACD